MAHHGLLKPQIRARWDILPAQKDMGEDSVPNQGIHCTGGFLEAAQVELVNYKMPHMRSVI